MTDILLVNPFSSGKELFKQCPDESGKIGHYQFFINEFDREYDYAIVLDEIIENNHIKVRKGGFILFALEAPSIKFYKKSFLKQFDLIVSCQKGLKHHNVINELTTVFWFLKKNYSQLVNLGIPNKQKDISIITSNKVFTQGHLDRINFCKKIGNDLGKNNDFFGRGFKEFDDKEDVLLPYKFSIVIENENYSDWLTEKFCDCLLTYTFPIYYGCPNAEKYFDSMCFERIDIYNYEESKNKILSILDDSNFYKERLPFIIKARDKYLHKHNIFFKIIDIINSIDIGESKKSISHMPISNDKSKLSFIHRIKNKLNAFK